jgi:3-oxoacyl-[acyl-carrier-protein] synthase III
MNAYIQSVGVYLPDNIVTNDDISKIVDTNDEWIRSRSGIRERRILKDDSLRTVDIAALAAKNALERAGVDPSEVDGIIAGSMSPDVQFPAIACAIQSKIGCGRAFGFDITAACGFIPYAVNVASLMIRSGQAKKILVIGAEVCSRILDWSDRNTCVLFGDGAGALLISATDEPGRGIIDSSLLADGKYENILYLNQLGGKDAFLRMDGKAVFKLAVTELTAIAKQTLDKAGLRA